MPSALKRAIRVKNMAALRDRIQYLLHNPPKRIKMGEAALRFSEASAGATARLMKLIAHIYSNLNAERNTLPCSPIFMRLSAACK